MAEVVNISGRNVTVLEDGAKVKYTIAHNASIRMNGQPARMGQIEPGDEITLSGKGTLGFKNVEVKRDQKKIQAVAKERSRVVEEVKQERVKKYKEEQGKDINLEDELVAAAEARNQQELPDRGGDNDGQGDPRSKTKPGKSTSPTNPSNDLITAGHDVRGTDPDEHGDDDDEDDTTTQDEDLDSMTVAELKDLAHGEDINLHGATTKADIVKAIKKGRK